MGKTEIVKFLIETCKSKIEIVTEIYKNVGKTPIDVICEYGHLDLLKYYLPIHIETKDQKPTDFSFQHSSEDLSIFNSKVIKKTPSTGATAIQRACDRGKIQIVDYLTTLFIDKEVPNEFDINYQDEKSGENCALIACRNGNLDLVELLHKKFNANFHLLNKRSENAIQLATLGANKYPHRKYLGLIKYLAEQIGVDITYHYEETLMLSENKLIIAYLENKLLDKGYLHARKKNIERDNQIRAVVQEDFVGLTPEVIEKLKSAGKKFDFTSIFNEHFKDNSQSFVSSISSRLNSLEISSPNL